MRFPLQFASILIICSAAATDTESRVGRANADWKAIGNSPQFTRFSDLDQIRRDNVFGLRVAWIYHTGNASTSLRTSLECTPIVIDKVMYVTSPVMEVIALDAASGREIWKYNPFPDETHRRWLYKATMWAGLLLACAALIYFPLQSFSVPLRLGPGWFAGASLALFAVGATAIPRLAPAEMSEERRSGANRGLTWWQNDRDRRLLFAGGHRLVALDPDTGRPIRTFGDQGVVDLTKGLGRDIGSQLYAVTSPGVIYKNLIVVSARVGEGPKPAAPGHIRAFDVRGGEQKWIFHTIPHPGDAGYETWPADSWKSAGGANAWAGMSVDPDRGIVYAPTGAASFDFYGGDRTGQNLYSDSLLALQAETGKLIWQYQMVHHDLWDYDLPAPPNLVTVRRNGKPEDVAVQVVKNGYVFVLDRDTGEPVFPVEEHAVPRSELQGEQAWPTQPVPSKPAPLSRTELTENDLTTITAQAHDQALKVFRSTESARMFTPPSKTPIIVTPGFHGGPNWSGGSVDPATARWIVNTNEKPFILQISDAKFWQPFRYTHRGYTPFLDDRGYPAIQPPWGKLTAIDLNTGDVVWQVPLGEYPELAARGIPPTGTDNAGGSIITASKLVFIGATRDRKLRAFDLDNGKILWEATLDAAAHAAPCTYMVDGKQYIAIAAGGGTIIGSPAGDEYVAFALP